MAKIVRKLTDDEIAEIARLNMGNKAVDRLLAHMSCSKAEIDKLADFILSLDCGFPVANAEHPNGMSAVDAAIEYIKELR